MRRLRHALFFLLVFHLPANGASFIRFEPDREALPASWWLPPVSARLTPLATDLRPLARTVIRRELEKYPGALLADNLTAVYLMERISFYNNLGYAGTYFTDLKRVYLCFYPENRKYSAQVLHKEFSSILFHRHAGSFPRDSWQQANPPDFSYGRGGRNAVAEGRASTRMGHTWFARGFLYQYATSALEEDFNSIAGNLFFPLPEFFTAVRESSRIRAKVKLALSFYAGLAPDLTLDHFNRLSGGRLAALLDTTNSVPGN